MAVVVLDGLMVVVNECWLGTCQVVHYGRDLTDRISAETESIFFSPCDCSVGPHIAKFPIN